MSTLFWSMPIDQQLAARPISQHCPVGMKTLRQDLAPVRHEQQRRILQTLAKAAVVECRDQGLAGTSSRDDQVPESMMSFSFRLQALKHLALEGPRLQVEVEDLRRHRDNGRTNGAVEAVGVARWIVGLVVGVSPIAFECGLEFSLSTQASRLELGGHSIRRHRASRCASDSMNR